MERNGKYKNTKVDLLQLKDKKFEIENYSGSNYCMLDTIEEKN